MEIKAQITKKLQKYKADEIKTLYQLMLRVLSGNDDFRMVQNADTDDLRPVKGRQEKRSTLQWSPLFQESH